MSNYNRYYHINYDVFPWKRPKEYISAEAELRLTCASVGKVWVSLVALCAVADVPGAIDGVDALAVVADAGVVGLLRELGAGQGGGGVDVAVPDGPVKPQRQAGVLLHMKVGCPERVTALLHDEGVVTGAELLADARPGFELHQVIAEARRDVDVAAADAGAGAVLRAPGVVAVGRAPAVEGVHGAQGVIAVGCAPAHGVDEGVAAEDEELVVGVGDAVHVVLVEVYPAVQGLCGVAGGVVARPRHGQHHPDLRPRHHQQVQHPYNPGGGRQDRHGVVEAGDLKARAKAAGADAERVGDVDSAAALLAVWPHGEQALAGGRNKQGWQQECSRHR